MWSLPISEFTWTDNSLKLYCKCKWYFRIYLGNLPVSILFSCLKILPKRLYTLLYFPKFQFWFLNMSLSLSRLASFSILCHKEHIPSPIIGLCALPNLPKFNFRIEVTNGMKFEKNYSEYFWTTLGFKIPFEVVIDNDRFIIYSHFI